MMYSTACRIAALAGAVMPMIAAQTFTDCNPTEKTCPNVRGLAQSSYSVDLTNGVPKDWSMTTGTLKTSTEGGLFQINSLSDGPTIASDFSILFGSVEITMQAAPGAGIVSTFVMQSTDLDEIDLEIIGSQTGQVQSNYFGKGNTSSYDRGAFHPVDSPQASSHTYKVDWKPESTEWYVDGQLVRTLAFADAVGGKNYPQTPVNIRIGNWVAGRPGNQQGTIEWAGGLADMSKAPFNMYVTKITIQNNNPCGEYEYSDKTGDWQSIKCVSGDASSGSSSSSTAVRPSTSAAASGTTTSDAATTPIETTGTHSSETPSATDKPTPTPPLPSGAPGESSAASADTVLHSVPCEGSSTLLSATKHASGPIGTAPASSPFSPVAPPASIPQTQTTVFVTRSTTTCPVGHTVTSGSVTTTLSTPSVSTVYLTTTSTICTRCTRIETSPVAAPSTRTNGSAPSLSEPTVPVPTEPVPTEPAPTEPAPTEPIPTKPVPAEPAPTEPAPTEPAPTEPVPTEPAPTEPVPTEPAPTEPAPTEPVPTEPAPTEPVPTEPAPEVPTPEQPTPEEPVSQGPIPTNSASSTDVPGPSPPADSSDTAISPIATATAGPTSSLLTFSSPESASTATLLTSTTTVPAGPVFSYTGGEGGYNLTTATPSGSLAVSPITAAPPGQFTGMASRRGASVLTAGVIALAVLFVAF